MKKFLTLAFVAVAVCLSSCKKGGDDEQTPTAESLNGTKWKIESIKATAEGGKEEENVVLDRCTSQETMVFEAGILTHSEVEMADNEKDCEGSVAVSNFSVSGNTLSVKLVRSTDEDAEKEWSATFKLEGGKLIIHRSIIFGGKKVTLVKTYVKP